ncbi:MAG: DNA polymerase I, partial [Eubacteriales bacterium]|nr:DNA polymerase I [Eubacteriales bacterium]
MKLMVLDGNSLVNRAFYGVRMLNAPDGTPTNAIFGFLNILQHLLDEEQPEALCVTFDLPGPTFRHEKYEKYKGHRKGMPDELAAQMPILKELLDAMGIHRCEMAGYEADDLIGTISKQCAAVGWECRIVTGDRDSFQLLGENVRISFIKTRMGHSETLLYDEARFTEEYGFPPPRLVDLKALMGDSSDDIPGVPGVGEKTALDLMRRFGSLDAVYQNIDSENIRPAVRKKLELGRESALLSYELATIDRDVPLTICPEDAIRGEGDRAALYTLLRRLGFERFIERWGLCADDSCKVENCPGLPREEIEDVGDAETLITLLRNRTEAIAVLLPEGGLDALEICDGAVVRTVRREAAGLVYDQLLQVIFSPEVKKISHDVKDLCVRLLEAGLSAEGFVTDTALAAYLLEATETRYELPRLAAHYLNREADGAEAAFLLAPVLEEKLRQQGMENLYRETELPLCVILAEMERAGFLVDQEALQLYGAMLNEGVSRLEEEIWSLAGEKFNINSPKQLGEVLFEKLMLPAGKKTKTGWSTNADVLERLRGKHPIVQAVLDYRQLAKLRSTYAEGLLKVISPENGRIHTRFQMTVTATGRLSSAEPNLQNIPVRTKLGAELRRMFAAGPGMVLVDADYSQIELRLLAHIANDETMRQAFLDGEDVHRVTAAQVFNVPLEEVTPLQRSRAKAVNFGIVYGISA